MRKLTSSRAATLSPVVAPREPAPLPRVARRALRVERRSLPELFSRLDPAALSVWTLSFALVSYLALRDGGYDVVVRSQAGIVVWWLILLGALAGVLPLRTTAAGWVAIGLLGGFAAWSGLAVSWTESREQTVIELGRLSAYLGVLVLAILLQGRTAARHSVNGLACALGLVTVLAVLSRLHPQWFAPSQHFQFLGPSSARKLSYPLNYWNGLADFAAMGVPLLLAVAVGARAKIARALAAATLPLSAVCIYLTVSRGGVIALGVGIAVFLVLVPRRLEALTTLVVAAIGATVLLRATAARPALTSGIPSPTAIHQGTSLLALCAVVCLAVAVAQLLLARGWRSVALPAVLRPDRRATTLRAVALAAVLVVVGVAAAVPAKLDHAWHDFKAPSGVVVPRTDNTVFSRLQAANGNDRYQLWQAAFHANETHPWRGIGPGTFQFWWAAHPMADQFVRNAHSLYFETLAETGIIGLALMGGLLLWFVGVAVRRSLREPPALRLWIGAAAASLGAFLFSAAVEWVWQLAAIAATALILGAVIVAGRGEAQPVQPAGDAPPAGEPRRSGAALVARMAPRAALVLVAIAALGAILVPLAGQQEVRDSQTAAAQGHFAAALEDAVAAQRLQPYSASAHLQEALVLEAAGEFGPAASAAEVATRVSPSDWTTWLTLARIDARRGASTAALAAIHRARLLNPQFTLFAGV